MVTEDVLSAQDDLGANELHFQFNDADTAHRLKAAQPAWIEGELDGVVRRFDRGGPVT